MDATKSTMQTAKPEVAGKVGARVLVIPVSGSIDDATRLLDWYAANVRGPSDRLVLVRLLVPDCPDREDFYASRGGGSGASSSAPSTSCESANASDSCVESLMERQLEASVRQEARLVRRLRDRGIRSFRFIHAFGRDFTDCLLNIAGEQGACAVLAPLSAFAAEHDLARTYHLYRKARIGVIHAPEW